MATPRRAPSRSRDGRSGRHGPFHGPFHGPGAAGHGRGGQDHAHAHGEGHGHLHGLGHGHAHGHGSGAALWWSFGLTLAFAGVEALAGWWAGSLALLGDAGHMVSDATALGLAALAAWVARRPPSLRHSYGLGRAEVVAALANSLFMVAVVVGIAGAALERLSRPQPVAGGTVALVAALGLGVNLLAAWLLERGEQSLNTRAALLHVLGDLLGSVAALAAGLVIHFTGWTPIDPLLSLLISALILFSALRLLREALHILMEGVPPHLDLREVGQAMAELPGVDSVHDLHIWTLASGTVMLSAHVVVPSMAGWEQTLEALRRLLRERYGIDHVTLQPEPPGQVVTVPWPPPKESRGGPSSRGGGARG
ncbi:MAG: cation transporter [Gammaproteobacteria bacterium]|nr:MAG: cation transporter [Gammaproteobacteria bacterium]